MADLRYEPVLSDAAKLLAETQPDRALVVGLEVPPEVVFASDRRHLEADESQLPTGTYIFESADGTDVLVVSEGRTPGPPHDADWDAPDEEPLIQAYGWLASWWETAKPIPLPLYARGDDVITVPAGQEASVQRRFFDAGAWWYSIRVEGSTRQVRESGLSRPDFDDDPAVWVQRPAAPVERFAATLTRAKLREQLTDTVYSFRATKTIFRPYQFRPVMRLLDSGSLRLLIADEVGLGKTIEAGLVWTELDARKQANRVLVICPSMLVPKWRGEMEERFGYELRELDRTSLDELVDRVENDKLPGRYHAVVSLERLRVWEGLDRLAELAPRFDLIVVDEAHAFRNAGTRSNALGSHLADWADALVFLSATPLNLGNDDLFNLLQLLAPGEFDNRAVLEQRLEPNAVLNRISASFFEPTVTAAQRRQWLQSVEALTFGPAVTARPEYAALTELLGRPALVPADVADAKRLIARLHSLSAVVTRTRKVEVQDHKAVREAHPIEVSWTETEYELYKAFERWQRERALANGMPVGFATQMPLRIASTCLPAARDKVLAVAEADMWRSENLDAEAEPEQQHEDDDAPPPELIELARQLGDVDSKFDAFIEALLPIVGQGKQVLVFTFSRAALAYLERRLWGIVDVGVLHGDVKKDVRHDVMKRFRDHHFDVLLASRVASEGLDFEFCAAVVNYDLPWNPMEVEQRIGRIDRFGQTEDKVIVLNFHTPGTIETDIIERVHQRIGVFTDSIGELEPIIQSKLGDLRRAMFDFTLSEGQRERRLNEMLTAVEEAKLTKADIETAASYLSAADEAAIDGLEEELVSRGRYVGQPELAHLLDDWAQSAGASPAQRLKGDRLVVRGNGQMAEHLRGVQAAGERSGAEIAELERTLRDEGDILLSLDQEVARITGLPLVASTHPLVRAALRVPGHVQSRFSHVSYTDAEVTPGDYLVLVAISRWSGLRPAVELWTAGIALDTNAVAPEEVGLGLLVALAQGALGQPTGDYRRYELLRPLERAQQQLRRRYVAADERFRADNDALVRTRRISLHETFARKVAFIEQRIETLRAGGKTNVIHLQEAQLRRQASLLQEAESKLEAGTTGSLAIEYVAACVAQVGAP